MTNTPAPIVFLDTETDGLHPGRRVWEIAMIRRDETGQREKRMFVGIDLRNSDPYGLNVGCFWDRHPSGRKLSGKDPLPGPPVPVYCKHDAASEVMRWTFGAHLVGVNPAFDAETLAGLLRAEGYVPSWDYHLEDLVAETVGWIRARGGTAPLPWKSDVLSAMVGVEPLEEHERHTALGDARWAMRWYDALTIADASVLAVTA